MTQDLQRTLEDLLRKHKGGTIDAHTASNLIAELWRQHPDEDVQGWLREVLFNSEPILPNSEGSYNFHMVAVHAWSSVGSVDELIHAVFRLADAFDPDGHEKWAYTVYPSFRFVMVNSQRFSQRHLDSIRSRCRAFSVSSTLRSSEYPESFRTAILDLEKTVDSVEVQLLQRRLATTGASSLLANSGIGSAKDLAEELDATYLARQVARMEEAIAKDPELAIGTAKEFVETICKKILQERNVPLPSGNNFPRLVKSTVGVLKIVPDHLDNKTAGSKTIKVLVSNLVSIGQMLAELRNPHGTGHGKDAQYRGLEEHHAGLAVGAATTVGVFLILAHMKTP